MLKMMFKKVNYPKKSVGKVKVKIFSVENSTTTTTLSH
jgi:hypothetical protein